MRNDRREHPRTKLTLAGGETLLAVLADSRMRVRLGMSSARAARRMDQSIADVTELLAALPDVLALYRVKWGNLDPDANAALARVEAALTKIGSPK